MVVTELLNPLICPRKIQFGTIKELCFIRTLIGVKYNKTLKALTLCLYERYSSW